MAISRSLARTVAFGTCGRPSTWSPWMWVRTTVSTSPGAWPAASSWWSSSSSRVTWNSANVAAASLVGLAGVDEEQAVGVLDQPGVDRQQLTHRALAQDLRAASQSGAFTAVHLVVDADVAGGEGVDGDDVGHRGSRFGK